MKFARKVAALAVTGLLAGAGILFVGAAASAAAPSGVVSATEPTATVTATPTAQDCATPEKPDTPSVQSLKFDQQRRFSWPCRKIEITNNCNGTISLTVSNSGKFPTRFRVKLPGDDWISKPLFNGESDSTTFMTSIKEIAVESSIFGEWVTYRTAKWTWSAACLEVTSVSKCDNTFKVTVKNTSVGEGSFVWAVNLNKSEEILIKGKDEQSGNFNKGDVVQVRVGADQLFKAFEWVKPEGCTSTAPSSSAPTSAAPTSAAPTTTGAPVTTGPLYANCAAADAAGASPINEGEPGYTLDLDGDADGVACETDGSDLPVTGSSLTTPLITGGALAGAGAGVLLFMLYRRRRNSETAAE